MRIVAVANQKGGVGKTTLACHLALAARDDGARVLLIDLDTQANASGLLARDVMIAGRPGGAGALLTPGAPVEPALTPSGLSLLHGHRELDALDGGFSLADAPEAERRLRALAYDLVVVDTPPALGPRHLSPLLWADVALMPLEPTKFGADGLTHTLATLPDILDLNPHLVCRVAINLHVLNSTKQLRYIQEIEGALAGTPIRLLHPFLTRRVAVTGALDNGVPVWSYVGAERGLRTRWRDFCREALA